MTTKTHRDLVADHKARCTPGARCVWHPLNVQAAAEGTDEAPAPDLSGVARMYFYRLDADGHAHLLHAEDGTPVTRLAPGFYHTQHRPLVWPIGSASSAYYEHPSGIVVSESDARDVLGLGTDGQVVA